MKELTIENLKTFIKDYLKGYSPLSDNPYDQGVLDVLKDLKFEFLYKETKLEEHLKKAKELQNSRLEFGAEGVMHFVTDVDGDWLKNW